MTDWSDITRHVQRRFDDVKQPHDNDDALMIRHEVDRNREQGVWITRHLSRDKSLEFVVLQSDFAYAHQDGIRESIKEDGVRESLKEAEAYLIGGLVQHGETLAIRHAIALRRHLDLKDFDDALELVAKIADKLEERYGTTDRY